MLLFWEYFTYNDKTYIYNIWDTAGQEQYKFLNKIFLQIGNVILLVYSIDNERSFNEIKFRLNYVKENLGKENYFLALSLAFFINLKKNI